MPVKFDGQFALVMWLDPDVLKDPDDTMYDDNVAELRERAAIMLKAGRYKAFELFRLNAATQDWASIEEFY
jgi:hypothetical protein